MYLHNISVCTFMYIIHMQGTVAVNLPDKLPCLGTGSLP